MSLLKDIAASMALLTLYFQLLKLYKKSLNFKKLNNFLSNWTEHVKQPNSPNKNGVNQAWGIPGGQRRIKRWYRISEPANTLKIQFNTIKN